MSHTNHMKKPLKATSFELAMEEYPPHKVHDTKSLVMWLWRIHNHINQELMADTNLDLNMYGEKNSPKMIYPPEKSKHFPRSEDDIFDYLSKYLRLIPFQMVENSIIEIGNATSNLLIFNHLK